MRRLLLIGWGLAIGVLAAAPGAALGATVRVSPDTGGDLLYRAAPGERNDPRITVEGGGPDQWHVFAWITIVDSVPIEPGQDCARPDPAEPRVVRCGVRVGDSQARVRLGDRGDRVSFSTNVDFQAVLIGGRGSDELTGGARDDVLVGGPGDDVMFGAAGADVFDEGDAANGSDEMSGGFGPDWPFPVRDRVDYSGRRHPVRADLARGREDGERGERDWIRVDVESVTGGRGDDRLSGNRSGNRLSGGPGTDVIAGRKGSDTLLAGRPGFDRAPTDDRLNGGSGSDQLSGSAGANLIEGGPGADLIYAGNGRDKVRALDMAVDQVHCGAGDDLVRNDGFEYLLSCERGDPYSEAALVPLQVSIDEGRTSVSLLLGCRERHPAACEGTLQLELRGEAISPELAVTGLHRHRWPVSATVDRPLQPLIEANSDFVARIRSHSSTGAPTDDRIPVPSLLVGFPFL